MMYSEYVQDNFDRCIDYAKYVQDNIDKCIGYAEYLQENIDNSIRYSTYDLVSDPSFKLKSDIPKKIDPQISAIYKSDKISNPISENLGWWCQKNKTSSDFWKYKL